MICHKCGKDLDLKYFNKCTAKKNGLSYICKVCKKELDDEYRRKKKLNAKMGVYKLVNKINEKMYVGSTTDLEKREKDHFRDLKANIHRNHKLQEGYDEFGKDAFTFIIIKIIEDENLLLPTEQYWIDFYESYTDDGYNIASHAGNSIGVVASLETRNRQRQAKLGKKLSEENRESFCKARKRGIEHPKAVLTEEQVYKIRELTKQGIGGMAIARIYGIGKSTVYHIQKGETWKHLLPKEVLII